MTTGERIKFARKKAGLTQKALGEKCNMPDSQIRQYELGMVNPKIDTLNRIAEALSISIAELMDPNLLSLTNSVIDLFSNGNVQELDTTDPCNPLEHYLISKFRELNEKGQKKSTDYIDDLTQIPEYKKE